MNCIVKSEDQNVLDMIQDVAQIRSCVAYHSIDLCVTKLSVTAKILTSFIKLFPLNICDETGEPLIYKAIIKAFEKLRESIIKRCNGRHLLSYVTKHIATEVVSLFSLKITFRHQAWTLKKAVYDSYIPEQELFANNFKVVCLSMPAKARAKLVNDLSKKVLTNCIDISVSEDKKKYLVAKRIEHDFYSDCIVVHGAQ